MSDLIPLNLLRRGSRAEICQVVGNDGDVRRLDELGIRQGSMVEVVQHGCPCIVRLRGAKYCLRGDECTCVLVRMDDCMDDCQATEI